MPLAPNLGRLVTKVGMSVAMYLLDSALQHNDMLGYIAMYSDMQLYQAIHWYKPASV